MAVADAAISYYIISWPTHRLFFSICLQSTLSFSICRKDRLVAYILLLVSLYAGTLGYRAISRYVSRIILPRMLATFQIHIAKKHGTYIQSEGRGRQIQSVDRFGMTFSQGPRHILFRG